MAATVLFQCNQLPNRVKTLGECGISGMNQILFVQQKGDFSHRILQPDQSIISLAVAVNSGEFLQSKNCQCKICSFKIFLYRCIAVGMCL